MTRPRLLDLFCGAGGAAMGYHRAGFDVVGVDLKPQPHYPFEFHEADSLEFPLDGFDVIHASPPCQAYSVLAAMHPRLSHERLIEPMRKLLLNAGLPFVIENVETSPLQRQPGLFGLHGVVLCGSSFGFGVTRGYLRRHRLFESNVAITQPSCQHKGRAVGVYGHGGHVGKHRMLYRQEASEALGIDWMSRDEMTQAIPPAYTEFIGQQLLEGWTTTHLCPPGDSDLMPCCGRTPLEVPRTDRMTLDESKVTCAPASGLLGKERGDA